MLRPTTEFSHGWSEFCPEQYCLFLDAKTQRSSDHMEEWVRDWFRESIIFLGCVDALLSALN